jgi:hypothetical protein
MSRLHSLTLALLAAALLPAAAQADGLPVPVDDAGPTGIASADGSARFVTVPAGRGTVVERVNQRGGAIAASAFVRGKLTIPVVALDGTPGGLSHDGRTLVLIRPRSGFPRATTTLAILGAHGLGLRRQVTLKGDFSFDALSPDGRTVYLIQYTSRNDPGHFLVRTLDPATGRLQATPVVDPNERTMRGLPMQRVTSADGRWHYTLYDGAAGHPFVHALDTQGRRARCVDLPSFPPGADPYGYDLTLTGGDGSLSVGNPKQPFALMDTRTFRVSTTHATRPAAHRPASGGGDGGSAWPAVVALALLLPLGAAAAVTRRSRRRRAAA